MQVQLAFVKRPNLRFAVILQDVFSFIAENGVLVFQSEPYGFHAPVDVFTNPHVAHVVIKTAF